MVDHLEQCQWIELIFLVKTYPWNWHWDICDGDNDVGVAFVVSPATVSHIVDPLAIVLKILLLPYNIYTLFLIQFILISFVIHFL